MTTETDQSGPMVEITNTGSTADRIAYCEGLENELLARLYQAGSAEEQKPIMEKMDYIASLLDRLNEFQKAIQTAGNTVTNHADGGFTPHDRIRALDVLMEEAAGSGDIHTYKMYRTQKNDLVRKYGAPGHTTSTSARNPRIDELKAYRQYKRSFPPTALAPPLPRNLRHAFALTGRRPQNRIPAPESTQQPVC